MSSEGSVSSGTSRIRQFGLYRSIDARTEEFLKLSRKRQIRQGCACAAVSTAVTVTVIIVILLIYEYAIAVEWSLVQSIRGGNGIYNVTKILSQDTPFADKLDRSFFGFDQDYYERMPLLVNALQESNYVDPVTELSRPLDKTLNRNTTIPRIHYTPSDTYRRGRISKSSPRPFIFEYRSATPLPFSKTYSTRSWVDSYRNAQRLQNIRQVIRYLEKTINAKTGDMHSKPTTSHSSIAFSGVFMEPKIDKDKSDEYNGMELSGQNSNKVETYANHQEDPLFNFKPDSPGEVNLLADTFLRFSPYPISSNTEDIEPTKIPMFRRIPYRNKCKDQHCNDSGENKNNNLKSLTEHNTELPTSSTKSFSVMLNLYPLKPNASPEFNRQDVKKKPSMEKLYITTSKPLIQFRQKSVPMRQTNYRYKRPRYLARLKKINEANRSIVETKQKIGDSNNDTTMIVHVDVFSPEDKNGLRHRILPSTTKPSSFPPSTEKPVVLTAGQVEDHHDGSSGLITVQVNESIAAPPYPQVTTSYPFFDTTAASTEVNHWTTNPPDVLKFSAEDAKVPDHYMNLATTQTVPTEIDWRNVNVETTKAFSEMGQREINLFPTQIPAMQRDSPNWTPTQAMPSEINTEINWLTTKSSIEMDGKDIYWMTTQTPIEMSRTDITTQAPTEMDRKDVHLVTTQLPMDMEGRESSWVPAKVVPARTHNLANKIRDTLIIKLRNQVTTTESIETTTEEIEESTTSETYVPQMNGHGHYRSFATRKQSRYSPETYRKRKLEMSVTGFRSYVPMYVEIKRNKTKSVEEN